MTMKYIYQITVEGEDRETLIEAAKSIISAAEFLNIWNTVNDNNINRSSLFTPIRQMDGFVKQEIPEDSSWKP